MIVDLCPPSISTSTPLCCPHRAHIFRRITRDATASTPPTTPYMIVLSLMEDSSSGVGEGGEEGVAGEGGRGTWTDDDAAACEPASDEEYDDAEATASASSESKSNSRIAPPM